MPRFLLNLGFLRFTLSFLSGFPGFFDKGESLLEGGNGCFPCWLVYVGDSLLLTAVKVNDGLELEVTDPQENQGEVEQEDGES